MVLKFWEHDILPPSHWLICPIGRRYQFWYFKDVQSAAYLPIITLNVFLWIHNIRHFSLWKTDEIKISIDVESLASLFLWSQWRLNNYLMYLSWTMTIFQIQYRMQNKIFRFLSWYWITERETSRIIMYDRNKCKTIKLWKRTPSFNLEKYMGNFHNIPYTRDIKF